MEKLAGFFEIPIDRLLHAPFDELLPAEVADVERYRRVEQKITSGSKPRFAT